MSKISCDAPSTTPPPTWEDMSTAPKDGTIIEARGREWGDPTGRWFTVKTFWKDGRWTDENYEWSYRYLTRWRPL